MHGGAKGSGAPFGERNGNFDMGDLPPKQFVNVECCASGLRPLERL
jgi:hypothetical protein